MTINIYQQIDLLIQYGLQKNLILQTDVDFTRNALLESLKLEDYLPVKIETEHVHSLVPILEKILDWASDNGRLEVDSVTYRDLLDTEIMGHFVPRPSEVNKKFFEYYMQQSPIEATEYFYQLAKDSHYIRRDRIAKNKQWHTKTDYGDLEITINLSKPEKDPAAIAAARNMPQKDYPICLLCKENVGYKGRINHPARQTLRTIPFEIANERWHLQFSPYVYYQEHAILFKDQHEPMKISKMTFKRLLELTEKLPHYFIGSNADLPIVGGSILSHDHFQGGYYDFPMAKAEVEDLFSISNFPNVKAGIVRWPMSVIRLQGMVKEEVVEAADVIFQAWKSYRDERVEIIAFTGDTPHNTITPIARRAGELYELDLVLRNNRTNEEHPMGIFHPHEEVHHIKKENIGLIEVMGLAVLPGRLKDELNQLEKLLLEENSLEKIAVDPLVQKHLEWAKHLVEKHQHFNQENANKILREEVGHVFENILEHAGVFKRDNKGKEAFKRFVESFQ
ncbi:UDP-glucose--hexose-1-phosphate uridylyltransferase [Sutcliffiella rhizosphaerae]|uniref:Galactose-1-phosphate uridylyltransferase n=1 Tax=Sutcliffiella rhizosphaerae TaxID=2880967 RepID=A0ABN8A7M2_9BACI|nr:UDP-glucose--hexose-1-phosphate uridylyltransferase [Sutcliffiella rhizosphaerae]CAG9621099.1 Galactose-1-phosphate uridylyltransferase [Sutcliffiella rhizosphaerae]